MKHDSEVSMLFHLLSRTNFNQDWNDVEYDLGYDIGDYAFKNLTGKEIIQIAKDVWLRLYAKNIF